MKQPVSLSVNGRSIEALAEPRTHLTDFVRDALRLTGTHLGCEHGVCGACTVLINGAPARSCIAYAIACNGADIRTIEGFGDDPLMQALRDAFARHHALQCGYCTPGMLITAYDIVRRLPGADETRVREELSGNLCRCTGYVGIVEAVRSVLDETPALGGVAHTAAIFPFGPLPSADAPSSAPVHHSSVAPKDAGSEQSVRTTPLAPPDVLPSTDAPPATLVRHPSAAPKDAGAGHEILLAIPPDTLWPVLQDIATMVRCLPGASLTGPADTDPLSIEMAVAIGPMRARFEGTARVAFDDRHRAGVIEGSGHDPRTRSTSKGRIEFSVRPSQSGGSVLTLALQYTLKGPLAQFSRSAVVDAIVEQLLDRFAANLATVASGRKAGASPPLGGLGLAITAFRSRLRRWLASSGD